MWHNLLMLYLRWDNVFSSWNTQYAGTLAGSSEKNKSTSAVVPLQVKYFHLESCVNYLCKWQRALFCMNCCSVLLFLKIYISFHVFKVNGLNLFFCLCARASLCMAEIIWSLSHFNRRMFFFKITTKCLRAVILFWPLKIKWPTFNEALQQTWMHKSDLSISTT